MRSNDKIPEDEMLLAEACAAAKAKGLAWCLDVPFRDARGMRTTPDKARQCCALGALHFAGVVDMTGRQTVGLEGPLSKVIFGNDGGETMPWTPSNRDDGESLGHAFRCFMTQTESDPATERLIRERSGK